MGYPASLFVSEDISAEFKCGICLEVLKDAQMVVHCQNMYCALCLKTWYSKSKTCPADRTAIHAYGGWTKPQRAFTNLLNALEVYCPFKHLGCAVITTLEHLKNHKKMCDHNAESKRPCVGGCGAVVKVADAQAHSCVEFLKNELKQKQDKVQEMNVKLKSYEVQLKEKKTEEVINTFKVLYGRKHKNGTAHVLLKACRLLSIKTGLQESLETTYEGWWIYSTKKAREQDVRAHTKQETRGLWRTVFFMEPGLEVTVSHYHSPRQ